MDMIVILYSGLGAGAALAGYALVLLARRPAQPRLPEARCSCRHSSGEHSGPDGHCAGLTEIEHSTYDSGRGRTERNEFVPCPCARYDGADPEQLRLLRGA